MEISVSSERGGTPSRANSCCAAMWHATSKRFAITGIVYLVIIPEENTRDEEEDAEENAQLLNQKNRCRVSHAEAM